MDSDLEEKRPSNSLDPPNRSILGRIESLSVDMDHCDRKYAANNLMTGIVEENERDLLGEDDLSDFSPRHEFPSPLYSHCDSHCDSKTPTPQRTSTAVQNKHFVLSRNEQHTLFEERRSPRGTSIPRSLVSSL